MADDASNLGTVTSGGRFGIGYDEFGFADRTEVLRTIGPIARMALDKDRRFHLVASASVAMKVIEPIWDGTIRRPQMVVGIDDPLVGVNDVLGDLGEPFW